MDVEKALKCLGEVLRTVGARLVVYVEDAERAGADFDPQHVQRLLVMLRETAGISFVLATDPKLVRFDFAKVCDHVDVMPQPETQQVRGLLHALKEHCRAAQVIGPMACKDILDTGPDDFAHLLQVPGNESMRAITELLDTPRKLKSLTRRIDRIWVSLQGEIDFEEVIVTTVLREGAPEVFDFLVRNRDELRRDTNHRVRTDWESALSGKPQRGAIQHLVDLLQLPGLPRAI
jgi:hypothetical protein